MSLSNVNVERKRPNLSDPTAQLCLAMVKGVPRKNSKLDAVLKVVPNIDDDHRCLDIGVGSGGLAYYYSTSGRWTFLEPNQEHLEAAKKLLNGKFVLSEGETYLKSGTDKYDLVVGIAILFFFPDQISFFSDIRKRLSANGKLVITGDNTEKALLFGKIRNFLGIYSATGGTHRVDYNYVKANLVAAGFEIQNESFSCGPVTLALQTVLDAITVQLGRMKGAKGNDQLTIPVQGKKSGNKMKLVALTILRLVSEITKFIDSYIVVKPKYEFAITAGLSAEKMLIQDSARNRPAT